MTTQTETFSLWLLISWGISRVLTSKTACSVCFPKHLCSKEFHFSFCPGCELKSPFLIFLKKLCITILLYGNILKSIRNILCTERQDIAHARTAFLVGLLGLCWFTTQSIFRGCRSPHIWSAWTLLVFHTPFLFKRCEQAKCSVSCLCTTSLKVGPKSSLRVRNAFLFGKLNKKFGCLLNHEATVIRHFNKLPLSRSSSSLWNLMPSNGISTKHSIIPRIWNTVAQVLLLFLLMCHLFLRHPVEQTHFVSKGLEQLAIFLFQQ
jgi:FtsH-binding integral membrane protein